MDEDEVVLEEGEISDDSDTNNYTPLERPSNYAASQPSQRFPVVQDSDDSDEQQSSESDSDSDNATKRSKKPKIKLKPKLTVLQSKRKKYDIWSTKAQEDVLAETLNSCDVTLKDRSRDVETYDYTMGEKYYGKRTTHKRSREDRKNVHLRLGKRNDCSDEEREKTKGAARIISDLGITLENSEEEIAKDIANKLFESNEELIMKILSVVGKEKSINIFNETKRIEEEGGIMIMNQTRRRTPGGVFLFLVREDEKVTTDQKNQIFQQEKLKYRDVLKQKRKQKTLKLKQEIAASRQKLLPELLSRAEMLNASKPPKEEEEEDDVINPPPTPETDCHENDNSGDGMEAATATFNKDNLNGLNPRQVLTCYDDDFLDINNTNDMDLF